MAKPWVKLPSWRTPTGRQRDQAGPHAQGARALDAELEELPAIEPPAGHQMTDDFLHAVARAYALAALKGLAPAPAIAEQAGVSPRAVHFLRTGELVERLGSAGSHTSRDKLGRAIT
jgi:hypothetical protein